MSAIRWLVALCVVSALLATGCARRTVLAVERENRERVLDAQPVVRPAAPRHSDASSWPVKPRERSVLSVERSCVTRVLERTIVP
ncbi:MAG: hypothetical protein ACLF0G_07705 [Candidatus Brocadiia bacterium]